MIVTPLEIFDAVLMIVVVGYIFSDFLKIPTISAAGFPIRKKGFDKEAFLRSIYITAPAIILHELAHKFVAMGFGANAIFNAHYLGLGIGVFLKLVGSPFIFFVPAFVSITEALPPLTHATVALAGPLMNLILWIVAKILFPRAKTRNMKLILLLTRKVNGFLFILNMLPIPGFDGFHFFRGIWQAFF
jgi:Zn-dependent protease